MGSTRLRAGQSVADIPDSVKAGARELRGRNKDFVKVPNRTRGPCGAATVKTRSLQERDFRAILLLRVIFRQFSHRCTNSRPFFPATHRLFGSA